jgi:hypothetical protein
LSLDQDNQLIEMAKLGERDPHKLCEAALLFLAQANRRDAPA